MVDIRSYSDISDVFSRHSWPNFPSEVVFHGSLATEAAKAFSDATRENDRATSRTIGNALAGLGGILAAPLTGGLSLAATVAATTRGVIGSRTLDKFNETRANSDPVYRLVFPLYCKDYKPSRPSEDRYVLRA